ncbi:basement membrane-specific heparan sulfate proteoglycan core protein-like [Nilaparvata lugens]|uniref:basement membrane-specific heparan sulfate proteoglycan core protein-like n=1 Tax=Nilaparvata lugens TaxID=108931 RepID=UPI00193E6135|nr:basement membrane-specific heparan sulfate proteoglycan core protein-like [Nilaparvata lugens]XP_039277541.1 basement membrane-specific heparan sulfate proteoglycan core protein-like [Nilaparvata lugens]XP_039277542.1 basement membrane-specific heparan sulfate proteoglycan core protein-like [Nilaparvata lugens]
MLTGCRWFLLLASFSACDGISLIMSSHQNLNESRELQPHLQPFFDLASSTRNVTTPVGQTAFLHCTVEQLGDKSVSWMRRRDLHILTAGSLAYTSDQRFQVVREEGEGGDGAERWTLVLRFAQPRDSGVYECQVSSEPKISLAFQLTVQEPRASILGASEVHVRLGSGLRLRCVVGQAPHALATLRWYRADAGGGSVGGSGGGSGSGSEMLVKPANDLLIDARWSAPDGLVSTLTIPRVMPRHQGNYSCRSSAASRDTPPARVYVHVLTGEHPAAMQHGSGATGGASSFHMARPLILLILLLILLTHPSLT